MTTVMSHEVTTPTSVKASADQARAMMAEMVKADLDAGSVMVVQHEGAPTILAPAAPQPTMTPPSAPAGPDGGAARIAQLEAALGQLQGILSDESRDTWRQKYRTIDGILKKRKTEDLAKIAELEVEVRTLQGELARHERGGSVELDEPVDLDAEDQRLVDRLGVAPEDYALMKRKMTGQPSRADKAQDVAKQSYLSTLNVLAPGWQDTKDDPMFSDYLNGFQDNASGRTLLEVLRQADADADSVMVAKVYNEFFSLSKTSRGKLARTLEPNSGSRGGRQIRDNTKPLLSQADYLAFSHSITQGTFKGTPAEAENMRKMYTEAIAEGRLVN